MFRYLIKFAAVAAVVFAIGCGPEGGCGRLGSCIPIPELCDREPEHPDCRPGSGGICFGDSGGALYAWHRRQCGNGGTAGIGGMGGAAGSAGIGGQGGYSGTGGLGGVGGLGGFGGSGTGGTAGNAGQGGTAGAGGFGGSGTGGDGGVGGSDGPCTCGRDCLDGDKCTYDYCLYGICGHFNWCDYEENHGR